jgi:hypothetical protein
LISSCRPFDFLNSTFSHPFLRAVTRFSTSASVLLLRFTTRRSLISLSLFLLFAVSLACFFFSPSLFLPCTIFHIIVLTTDLREDIKKGVYIENVTEELASTPADAFKVCIFPPFSFSFFSFLTPFILSSDFLALGAWCAESPCCSHHDESREQQKPLNFHPHHPIKG